MTMIMQLAMLLILLDVGVAGATSTQVEGRAGGHQADTQGNLLQLRRGQ